MTASDLIRKNFDEAREALREFTSLEENFAAIERAGRILSEAIKNGNKIISCGNGGSMCDAMHFAEELSGKFRNDRISLPAISISDPSYLTCTANDFGYNNVFSRFIEGMGRKGDVLLAISTSGNSGNIINAIEAARAGGMKIIGLTGKGGGRMASMCDVEIRSPYSEYSDRAQEIHIKVIHSLIHLIEYNM